MTLNWEFTDYWATVNREGIVELWDDRICFPKSAYTCVQGKTISFTLFHPLGFTFTEFELQNVEQAILRQVDDE